MSPETYEEAWARAEWSKADADAERRERQRIAARIEELLADHRWLGGRWCTCGARVDGPTRTGHSRHLLEVALELDQP